MREPCYKCKFEHKPITVEPCDHCSDVYIKTGDHPAFQYAKPITNYDRIIRKTPEELAEIMVSDCPPNYPHGECREYEKYDGNLDCRQCWLDWLKEEVQNEQT